MWQDDTIQLLITLSTTVGFFAASIALLGRYKDLPSMFTGPNVCKLEAGGCQVLFRSKQAALLGLPNSALGVIFYPLILVGYHLHWPMSALFIVATLAFLMTIYLAVFLLKRKLECRICWIGHFANTILWLVLLLQNLQID